MTLAAAPAAPESPATAAGHRSIDFEIPGELLAAAITDEGPRQVVWLLLAEQDQPPTLHRLDMDVWEQGIEPMDVMLDPEVNQLAAAHVSSTDADGAASRLLVGKADRIFELRSDSGADAGGGGDSAGPLVRRLGGTGFAMGLTAQPRHGLTGFTPRLERWPIPSVGRLELRDLSSGGAVAQSFPLPVDARRGRSALLLTSPSVSALDRAPTGAAAGSKPLYLAGPESFGDRRLRTWILRPPQDPAPNSNPASNPDSNPDSKPNSKPSRTDGSLEAWSQLPSPETVEEAWYALVDGRPMLLVTTYRADRLGIFETRRLRLFPLQPDRRRAGRPPVLAVETASRRWQALGPAVTDLDGDGHDDLLLLQPKGLDGDSLLVEGYIGDGRGGFRDRPRKSLLPVESDGIWHFGADLDGDGHGDLVALGAEGLTAFAGIAHRHRRRILSTEPLWLLPASAEASSNIPERGEKEKDQKRQGRENGGWKWPPRLLTPDLDGDGRGEAILIHSFSNRTAANRSRDDGDQADGDQADGGTRVLVVATGS